MIHNIKKPIGKRLRSSKIQTPETTEISPPKQLKTEKSVAAKEKKELKKRDQKTLLKSDTKRPRGRPKKTTLMTESKQTTELSNINLPKVINPFDASIRSLSSTEFTDFTRAQSEINQYQPTLLQQQIFRGTVSQHLIHTKLQSQSASVVRKNCGVSYVKQSESRQVNVDYEKLDHTIFQGSYNV